MAFLGRRLRRLAVVVRIVISRGQPQTADTCGSRINSGGGLARWRIATEQGDGGLKILLEGNIGAGFEKMEGLGRFSKTPLSQRGRSCRLPRLEHRFPGPITYASAHSCRLNSACCARRWALVTFEETFFSGGGGVGSAASFCSVVRYTMSLSRRL
jgi:hypothetical protein